MSTTHYLNECIQIILNKQPLCLNMKKVTCIIMNELKISLKNVANAMRYVLCECLCYYLKVWPGWKNYFLLCTNEETKANYHGKLKDYLITKLNYVIQHKNMFIQANRKELGPSKMVQTDSVSSTKINKPEAPYDLIISGQPYFLNNIGFIESNNDVLLSQHPGRALSHLNIRQLLNYPYVKVTVNLLDIIFSRSNSHKFMRYISESKDSVICPETHFIDFVRKDNPEDDIKVYNTNYISEYFKQFLYIAKCVFMVNRNKIIELEMVFKQFLRDIVESNVQTHISKTGELVNTMATNTSVCFNIGQRTYVRNKRMSLNNDSNKTQVKAINFCEILIPKMVYTLSTFTAEEDCESSEISFKGLSSQFIRVCHDTTERNKFNEMITNSITYECLWCASCYTGEQAYPEMENHLRAIHKGEQAVVCFKCRGEFAIAHLAGSRWNHDCEKKQEREVSSSVSSNSTTIINGLEEIDSQNSQLRSRLENKDENVAVVNDTLYTVDTEGSTVLPDSSQDLEYLSSIPLMSGADVVSNIVSGMTKRM